MNRAAKRAQLRRHEQTIAALRGELEDARSIEAEADADLVELEGLEGLEGRDALAAARDRQSSADVDVAELEDRINTLEAEAEDLTRELEDMGDE